MTIDQKSIITAYAERAEGPGWHNMLVWVIYRDRGELRETAVQWDEMTPEMQALFDVSAAAHASMTGAVKRKAR